MRPYVHTTFIQSYTGCPAAIQFVLWENENTAVCDGDWPFGPEDYCKRLGTLVFPQNAGPDAGRAEATAGGKRNRPSVRLGMRGDIIVQVIP